jgi:hypothetical protein
MPLYQLRDDGGFERVGARRQDELQPVDDFDGGGLLVRWFPVIERRGDFLLTVIDARTDERAWIREHGLDDGGQDVFFSPLEDALVGRYLDVTLLRDGPSVALYRAPSSSARLTPREARRRLSSGGTHLRVLRVEGDFALLDGEDGEDLQPVGWVRIRDERGLLVVWPEWVSGC